MQTRNALVPVMLVAVGLLALSPVVYANPITASLNWSPNPNPVPGSVEHGAANILIDTSDCPSGAHYSGSVSVTTPSALKTSHNVGSTACGTSVSFDYPTNFDGGSTLQCGTYVGEFKGTTTQPGVTFDIIDNFTVTGCRQVPEFSAPAMLMVGVSMVLLVALRKIGFPKI